MIRFRSPSTTHHVAERRWPKAVLLVAAALILITIGFRISPHAREALAWWEDDPQALAAIGLEKALTPSVVAAEIDVALAAKDPDLAASFLTLADQHGLMIAPAQRTRVAEASRPQRVSASGRIPTLMTARTRELARGSRNATRRPRCIPGPSDQSQLETGAVEVEFVRDDRQVVELHVGYLVPDVPLVA